MSQIAEINLLGPFQAKDSDGGTVEFSHRKVRALIAYLAVEQRPQVRERLASLLWARTGEDRARHNLRQALSRIRAHCPGLVDTAADTVSLDPAACTLDVIEFAALSGSRRISAFPA